MRIASTMKLSAVLLAMGFLAACSSTKEEPPRVSTDSGSSTSSVRPGSQEDLKTNVGDTVYFDFDSHSIRADAQATLQKQAAWLKKYPATRLVVEGHCDERGTREYNLALGDRRAYAVKEYLVSLGVDANRLQNKSYGKERPVCSESDESCWAQNRRGYSLVSAGGAGS
jgi:peptidoglycan-associated lipoprotein